MINVFPLLTIILFYLVYMVIVLIVLKNRIYLPCIPIAIITIVLVLCISNHINSAWFIVIFVITMVVTILCVLLPLYNINYFGAIILFGVLLIFLTDNYCWLAIPLACLLTMLFSLFASYF